LICDTEFQNDLEIVAYHEAGHAVVDRLLGIPLWYILMIYSEQAGKWAGQAIKGDPQFDTLWSRFNLDDDIPCADFVFHYPNYPDPYEEYKLVRGLCVIDYAGIMVEDLLYKLRGINKESDLLDENAVDIEKATQRIKQKFPPDVWEEELNNAKAHARLIVSHPVCWNMIENLALDVLSYIAQHPEPEEKIASYSRWYFPVVKIYSSFQQTLKQRG